MRPGDLSPEDELVTQLIEHSNEGTLHLLQSARHMLITRVIYDRMWGTELSDEYLDRLAEESWLAFVKSTIIAFHTWLLDAAPPGVPEEIRLERTEQLDEVIAQVCSDWEEWIAGLKPTLLF